MEIRRKIEIDAGHRVLNQKIGGKNGPCCSQHGHRYVIEICVDDVVISKKGDPQEGMVIDFVHMKRILMEELHSRFDHGTILSREDPMLEAYKADKNTKLTIVDFIPTAENLAKYWFELVEPKFREEGIKATAIRINETPNSLVIYRGDI